MKAETKAQFETYEEFLAADLARGFLDASRHFEEASKVHKTLQAFAYELDKLGVPYAVVGAMCLFFHGYRRFTQDVDILVTRDGLKKIHDELVGRDYVLVSPRNKSLRSVEFGVRIDFLIAGDYPGDGKVKPVAFPNPKDASEQIRGHNFLTLAKILEMKLASGMTHPLRMKDLADVQEAIKVLRLSEKLADDLHPFVRDKYVELWRAVDETPEDLW